MSKSNLDKYLALEYTKENMLDGINKSWKKFVKKEMDKDYFQYIRRRRVLKSYRFFITTIN